MREAISPLLVNEIVTSGTTQDNRKDATITVTIPAATSAIHAGRAAWSP